MKMKSITVLLCVNSFLKCLGDFICSSYINKYYVDFEMYCFQSKGKKPLFVQFVLENI